MGKYNRTGYDLSLWKMRDVDRYRRLYMIDEQGEIDAFNKQTGGDHYKKLAIQPMQYSLANKLNYAQANTIKYVTRYKDKNGIEDLKKAIHCIELLIEFEQDQGEKDVGND